MEKLEKTNVMRVLDAANILYKAYDYSSSGFISGIDVARYLGIDENTMFKTLVTVGKSGEHFVFVVPVSNELDLKKAANSVGEKFIEMVKSKELLSLTGYIHGGCSPIGMKKKYRTVIDETVILLDSIVFSAGKIGYQVEVNIDNLDSVLDYEIADIII